MNSPRTISAGRKREAARVRKILKAVAVGRLAMGEFWDWNQFLAPDITDYESMPRKDLKALESDSRETLEPRLRGFCFDNFEAMTIQKLTGLYEVIKAYRGIEIPASEFEQRYSPIRTSVYKGAPKHSTIVFSLWGLQFKYPEDLLTKDIIGNLLAARSAAQGLNQYRRLNQAQLERSRREIGDLTQAETRESRNCVLSCFNLVEAYLNGLAWGFLQSPDTNVSNRKRKLLDDSGNATIRDKLVKYPEIIGGGPLWNEDDEPARTFLNDVKRFRDSIVHPSPFSKPERFGGFDKLKYLYRTNAQVAESAANAAFHVIEDIERHLGRADIPIWLAELHETLVASAR